MFPQHASRKNGSELSGENQVETYSVETFPAQPATKHGGQVNVWQELNVSTKAIHHYVWKYSSVIFSSSLHTLLSILLHGNRFRVWAFPAAPLIDAMHGQ